MSTAARQRFWQVCTAMHDATETQLPTKFVDNELSARESRSCSHAWRHMCATTNIENLLATVCQPENLAAAGMHGATAVQLPTKSAGNCQQPENVAAAAMHGSTVAHLPGYKIWAQLLPRESGSCSHAWRHSGTIANKNFVLATVSQRIWQLQACMHGTTAAQLPTKSVGNCQPENLAAATVHGATAAQLPTCKICWQLSAR
jgi:hypothetical protein